MWLPNFFRSLEFSSIEDAVSIKTFEDTHGDMTRQVQTINEDGPDGGLN
jgi:hypothetical protein